MPSEYAAFFSVAGYAEKFAWFVAPILTRMAVAVAISAQELASKLQSFCDSKQHLRHVSVPSEILEATVTCLSGDVVEVRSLLLATSRPR